MVAVRHGTNFKIAKFSHATYRTFFSAVIPIAALSDVRGAFMVADQPATVEDMRIIAPTLTAAECRAALKTLRDAGILEHDAELGGEWVHDFEQWNPEPKKDSTNAERQARYRERQKASRNAVTPGVTDPVTNAGVTPPEVEVEVEGEVEGTPTTPLSSKLDRRQVFDRWIEVTGKTGRTLLDAKRSRLIDKALKTYPLGDVLDAVAGWQNSPYHRGENQTGTVYNDLELLLRDGSHIERFRDLERNPPQPKPGGTSASDQAAQWLAQANGGAA